jgi:hypothetical protein
VDEVKLVTVYTSQGMLPAHVIKGKLESAGIPVMLKYEAVGQILGLTADGLGQVRVQVPAELVQQALALIDEDFGNDDDAEAEENEEPTQ